MWFGFRRVRVSQLLAICCLLPFLVSWPPSFLSFCPPSVSPSPSCPCAPRSSPRLRLPLSSSFDPPPHRHGLCTAEPPALTFAKLQSPAASSVLLLLCKLIGQALKCFQNIPYASQHSSSSSCLPPSVLPRLLLASAIPAQYRYSFDGTENRGAGDVRGRTGAALSRLVNENFYPGVRRYLIILPLYAKGKANA
eukprot:GHVT01032389.1.p1 GENE.GHVT01032389.1~~GHVT01032389.1.p1  ORF type:complete len:194 (+),score=40.81 GHVT01032389.1:592-1173(+)